MQSRMQIDALLLAGGKGSRLCAPGIDVPKQLVEVGGAPIFIHALKALFQMRSLRSVTIVSTEALCARVEELSSNYLPELRDRVRVIAGGEQRQASAWRGLVSLAADPPDRVLIHDACRPCLSQRLMERIEKAAHDTRFEAWIPVMPATETIKRLAGDRVLETLPRHELAHAQTPQVFSYHALLDLWKKEQEQPSGREFTDDASLFEHYGAPVGVFEGERENLKLTYGFELNVLAPLLHWGDN